MVHHVTFSHNHLIGIYWYYAIGCATVQGPMAQCSSYGNLLGPDPDAHLPLAKSDPAWRADETPENSSNHWKITEFIPHPKISQAHPNLTSTPRPICNQTLGSDFGARREAPAPFCSGQVVGSKATIGTGGHGGTISIIIWPIDWVTKMSIICVYIYIYVYIYVIYMLYIYIYMCYIYMLYIYVIYMLDIYMLYVYIYAYVIISIYILCIIYV